MAQPRFINGYSYYATTFTSGLDAIVADLAVADPVDEDALNTALVDYIESVYYPATVPIYEEQQLQSIMASVFNAYTDSNYPLMEYFHPAQQIVIQQILSGLEANSIQTLAEYITLVDESLQDSSLSASEQAPLLMTTAILSEAIPYFKTKIATPGDWTDFFDPIEAVNDLELPKWLAALTIGAFIGVTVSKEFTPTDSVSSVGIANQMITIMAGALSTTFGLIVLQWTPRPASVNSVEMNLAKQLVVDLGNNPPPQGAGFSKNFNKTSKFCAFWLSSRSGGTRLGCPFKFGTAVDAGGNVLENKV